MLSYAISCHNPVCFVCIEPNLNPSIIGQKLHVHASRDGTAAGRDGGAAREHLFFS